MTSHTKNTPAAGWVQRLSLGLLAAAAWALSTGSAQARDYDEVYWSIGVQSPGVSVGVSNAPPPQVLYGRPVVVYPPAPVVVHRPHPYPYVRPVVVQPQPVVVYPGWGYGPRWEDRYERRQWRHRHHHRHHDRHDRRHDRDDD